MVEDKGRVFLTRFSFLDKRFHYNAEPDLEGARYGTDDNIDNLVPGIRKALDAGYELVFSTGIPSEDQSQIRKKLGLQ